MLTTLHEKRAANDPDYLYLEDQVSIAQEARSITALPLQESGRVALRDNQESKALAIENKRRVAKGLAPLERLDGAEEGDSALEESGHADETKTEQPAEAVADSDQDEIPDVLLVETGRILVDVITLRPNTGIAGRDPTSAPANNLQ